MAAPSELSQHLTVERPSGPHGHPSLTLLRPMTAPEALRALAPELSHLADESVHRLRPLRARPEGESDDRRERRQVALEGPVRVRRQAIPLDVRLGRASNKENKKKKQ